MNPSLDRLLSYLSEPAGPARSITMLTVHAPRLLFHAASALALSMAAASCVPALKYDEARSAAQVEMEGRRRAEYRIGQTEYERDQLRAELERRDSALQEREQVIDQSKLETTVATKERDQASELVEQLRGELARVGDHMRVFSDQKRDLETKLSTVDALRKSELQNAAERTTLRARMMRDLTLLLHQPIAGGDYGLDIEEGELTLNVTSDKLFTGPGAVQPEAATLLKAVSRMSQLYPSAKIRLDERDAVSGEVAKNSTPRHEALRKALTDQGVAADRLVIPPSSPPPPAAPAATEAPAPPALPAKAVETELEIKFVLG
jgi:flagellar motor protein MotB